MYACTTLGCLCFLPWGIPQLQSDWSLSCNHGLRLYYASYCENNKNTNQKHVLYVGFLRVAAKRFLADETITDNLLRLQRNKEEGEKRGTPRTGNVDRRRGKEEEEEVQRLWGVLYVTMRVDRIAIIRTVGEDDDGDRDCVLGVQACCLLDQNGDNVPAD